MGTLKRIYDCVTSDSNSAIFGARETNSNVAQSHTDLRDTGNIKNVSICDYEGKKKKKTDRNFDAVFTGIRRNDIWYVSFLTSTCFPKVLIVQIMIFRPEKLHCLQKVWQHKQTIDFKVSNEVLRGKRQKGRERGLNERARRKRSAQGTRGVPCPSCASHVHSRVLFSPRSLALPPLPPLQTPATQARGARAPPFFVENLKSMDLII